MKTSTSMGKDNQQMPMEMTQTLELPDKDLKTADVKMFQKLKLMEEQKVSVKTSKIHIRTK